MPMFLSMSLALLAGCSQPLSDFTLRLNPVLLESQRESLLELEPDIFVQVTYPDGNEEVWYAGTASEGTALELDALPPLPAQSKVALVAVQPGISTSEWSPIDALAYGSAVLTEDLANGKQQVDIVIEMPRVDDLAKRGTFRGADRKMGGAMALVPGAVYIFGGGDPDTEERLNFPDLSNPRYISSDTVLKSTLTSEGWSEFVEVGKITSFQTPLGFPAPRPDLEEIAADKRSGMSATPITVDDKTAILVVGGRPVEFTAYHSSGWFLWDPETDTPFEGDNKGNIDYPRSEHMAFPLGTNKVLIFGGQHALNEGDPRIEIWSAQNRKSNFDFDTNSTLTDIGGVGTAYAQLGSDVVVCGGLRVDLTLGPDHVWVPRSGCHRFAPNGNVSDLAPLPVPLSGAAMVALPDGGLLVSGGSDQDFVEPVDYGAIIVGNTPASPGLPGAWRWNPGTNEWAPVGDLVYPRANHRMVTLSNGKIMVIGGTVGTSAYFSPYGEQVRCVEIYDPEARTFEATTCTDVGQGAFPQVVSDGQSGIAVLEGSTFLEFTSDQVGGGNYGSVALIPE